MKINGWPVFVKVISHVSAIFGSVEWQQGTVLIKEKEMICNLENKSSSFLSFGDFNKCNGTFNVSSK